MFGLFNNMTNEELIRATSSCESEPAAMLRERLITAIDAINYFSKYSDAVYKHAQELEKSGRKLDAEVFYSLSKYLDKVSEDA